MKLPYINLRKINEAYASQNADSQAFGALATALDAAHALESTELIQKNVDLFLRGTVPDKHLSYLRKALIDLIQAWGTA